MNEYIFKRKKVQTVNKCGKLLQIMLVNCLLSKIIKRKRRELAEI